MLFLNIIYLYGRGQKLNFTENFEGKFSVEFEKNLKKKKSLIMFGEISFEENLTSKCSMEFN